MMVALILAQLVQSWPGLDSPRVQPGPTICVGECAGPVVWGPAERGRLVVACDMRSDTCSDGRKITTQRATPVPCEVAPGVWEMVPGNTGCYSVRGLESWAANTSYLSWGAELDRGPWVVEQQATVAKQDGFYRITGVNSNSRVLQALASPEAGDWTLSCIMRTAGSQNTRLRIYQEGASGGGFCNLDSSDEFSTYSCTQTVTGTPTRMWSHIYPGSGHVDVAGCWLTRTSTPGRACWGGEAPVTCAADRHTISTEGWPTESGEISVMFEVGALEGSARYIIDGRESGATTHSILMIDSAGRLRFDRIAGTPNLGPAVPQGKHHVRLRWGDGRTQVFLDGAQVMDVAGTPTWHAAAYLGSRYTSPLESLNGSISSLRIRSTP